ncbi:hypothetical protein LC612_36650 [Nostoc sp. CHAB 5834]|nr:hypothetical protein [Nostoc sp. CHAB 5834]
MTDTERWIREVAQEIDRSIASLKRAIKDTETEINSKYDVLLCYAKWSVPKLRNVEKQEALYKKRIENLEQLIYDLQNVTEKMKVEFSEQLERKDGLINTQNEIIVDRERTIANQARIIAEMEGLLRGLPLASGE